MGRQKKGNANAQRNNNAKKMAKKSAASNTPSFAEIEVDKNKA